MSVLTRRRNSIEPRRTVLLEIPDTAAVEFSMKGRRWLYVHYFSFND